MNASHFFNGPAPLLVDVVAAGVTVGLMGGVVVSIEKSLFLPFYDSNSAKYARISPMCRPYRR